MGQADRWAQADKVQRSESGKTGLPEGDGCLQLFVESGWTRPTAAVRQNATKGAFWSPKAALAHPCAPRHLGILPVTRGGAPKG